LLTFKKHLLNGLLLLIFNTHIEIGGEQGRHFFFFIHDIGGKANGLSFDIGRFVQMQVDDLTGSIGITDKGIDDVICSF